ncbi:hypothetical protein L226DRAFT_576897 [Lentinus tigrinus ALCF2SS1-7]|uniref:Uncharacterized protein n=1 Tax=Lentinus tigrinus ALCF2SS1-6 TaxID=1328759 RepID=A0A5C2RQA0_9APHY|nr:hypothetical protein L227DRAFT_617860 [Lentinus tigrinus ALCF2SS1-6]RPD67861.1 hypothetical protein L226DRAFT_576897 [Lentinus tigrinus ALCF2SS1-7]
MIPPNDTQPAGPIPHGDNALQPSPTAPRPLMVQISYGPLAVVAAKPILPARRKAVAATDAEHSLSIARTREKQEAIDRDLNAFYNYAKVLALDMSKKYGKKPDHYLRLMFSGGASMQKAWEPSAFNAWVHNLAKEANEDAERGEATKLLDLQREHLDEYHSLTPAEKRELVANFKEDRDSRKMGLRVNPRGRQADANHTFDKIEDLIVGLKCRIGVDGFYCFFKNNSEFQMRPRWYFTSPQLNRYFTGMIKKWDVETIGALGEAFSIAGCDLMSYLRNAKARADWLKTEIREKITAALVKITGNKKAVMQYKSYEKDIVLHYGIELVGWTAGLPFACPSSLPVTLEPLQNLLQAIDNGQCYFRRLSASEKSERRKQYDKSVADGTVATRQPRKDKGKPRGSYRQRKAVGAEHEEGGDEDVGGIAHGKKRARCAASSDEDSDSE